MFSSGRSNATDSSDDQSFIDVFDFDDNDSERWLCSVPVETASVGNKSDDLKAWLSSVDQEAGPSTGRRSIDTRTFTRAKRRSGRLSFDNGQMSVSSELKPQFLTGIFERGEPKQEPLVKSTGSIQDHRERQENIPLMLRPKASHMLSALMSEAPASIDSQASMEAFRNVCSSRDQLANERNDIDVNHMLMNISQPSLLYSSIISDGREGSLQNSLTNSFADSQILTDSMMEASMFKESTDTPALAEFLKCDETVVMERTLCKSLTSSEGNRTMVFNETFNKDQSLWRRDETFLCQDNNKRKNDVMSTSRSFSKGSSKVMPSSNNVSFIIKTPTQDSNTIVTLEEIGNRKLISAPCKPVLDTTFPINNTFNKSNRISGNFDNEPISSTPLRKELLQEVRRSSGHNLDDTFSLPPAAHKESDTTYVRPKSAAAVNKPADATYTQNSSPTHKSESQCTELCMDATFDAATLRSKSSSTDTLSEITLDAQLVEDNNKQGHTKEQPQRRELNRFSTFKKEPGSRPATNHRPSKNPTYQVSPKHEEVDPPQNRISRFNTFIKKPANSHARNSERSSMYLERNLADGRASDFPFAKPNSIPSKLQPPRQLTKLPQPLQKSNPNLGATKTTKISVKDFNNTGFNKGSQPNIARYSLNKAKSGSEQKLQQNRQSTDYSTATSSSIGSMGSVESIGSTTSAHSAPDLDDMQSTGSNSSRNTFVKETKNSKQVKNIDKKIDDEKFDGSTPKPKSRQILENNWVCDAKELGSPILKNGIERVFKECVNSGNLSRSESPEYHDVKTSSPLNTDLHTDNKRIDYLGNNLNSGIDLIKESMELDNKLKQMKMPSNTQAPATRLRQPTNYSANKVVNGAVSGIPRPASRIPASKISRPTLK